MHAMLCSHSQVKFAAVIQVLETEKTQSKVNTTEADKALGDSSLSLV